MVKAFVDVAVAVAESKVQVPHSCHREEPGNALESREPEEEFHTSEREPHIEGGAGSSVVAVCRDDEDVACSPNNHQHHREERILHGHHYSYEVKAAHEDEVMPVHVACVERLADACEAMQAGGVRPHRRPLGSSGTGCRGCKERLLGSGSHNARSVRRREAEGDDSRMTVQRGCKGIEGSPWWIKKVDVNEAKL